jgi:hypothetical protein
MIDELRQIARPHLAKCVLLAHEERTLELEMTYQKIISTTLN